MSDLEARIERLEAESAIRGLKATYFNACDLKDVATIRACFAPDAELDYPPVGRFGVDGLIAAFTEIAVGSPILDVHHGHNAEIAFDDADNATGRWNLGFATVDPRNRTVRIIASLYEDRYRRIDGCWRIVASRHVPRLMVDGTLSDSATLTAA